MDLSQFAAQVKRIKVYSVFVQNLAVAAEIYKTVNIQVGMAFALTHIEGVVHKTADPATISYANMQVTDSTGSWQFSDRELPMSLLCPPGREQEFYAPHILAGNSTLTVKVVSKDTVNALDAYIAFFGFQFSER